MIIFPHDPRYKFEIRADQPTDAVVIREIWCENVYETFDGDLSDTKIVLDLGANIGAYSIYMHSLNPDVKVYAFEPEPENLKLLYRNIELNNLQDNIEVIEKGVAGIDMRAFIDSNGGDSRVSISTSPDHTDIELISLPTWWEQQGKDFEFIDVLKIDVEGYEAHIIKGCNKALLNLCRYIVIEVDQTISEQEFGGMITQLAETHQLKIVGGAEKGGYIYGHRY